MKKLGRAMFLIFLILILICIFAACNQDGDNNANLDHSQSDTNVVTVHPNNGEKAFEWRISDEIPTLEREGYFFDGIYLDSIGIL